MAKKNNTNWKLRLKHGRSKKFETPEKLGNAIIQYFNWAEENPWYKYDVIKYGELSGKVMKVPIQRPYTLKALVHFLEIDFSTWQLYKSREEFTSLINRTEDFIYNQKLEGAIVGIFNANIIARHLGLVEKQDHTTKGEAIALFTQMLKDTSSETETEI